MVLVKVVARLLKASTSIYLIVCTIFPVLNVAMNLSAERYATWNRILFLFFSYADELLFLS